MIFLNYIKKPSYFFGTRALDFKMIMDQFVKVELVHKHNIPVHNHWFVGLLDYFDRLQVPDHKGNMGQCRYVFFSVFFTEEVDKQ